MAKIKRVIYSKPVTCIVWEDGTVTKSRCDDADIYDELSGFMLCVFKKLIPAKQMRKLFADYVYGDDPKNIKREGASKRFSIGDLPALDARCFLIGDDAEEEIGVLNDTGIQNVLQHFINEEQYEDEDEDFEEEVIIKQNFLINDDTPRDVTNIIKKIFKEYDL